MAYDISKEIALLFVHTKLWPCSNILCMDWLMGKFIRVKICMNRCGLPQYRSICRSPRVPVTGNTKHVEKWNEGADEDKFLINDANSM